jgi:molybdopterin-binding protein
MAIQGNSTVDVQVEGGTIATAAIHAGTTRTLSVRNPWPGKQAEVVNGATGAVVVAPTTAGTLSVPVTAGSAYLVEQVSSPTTALPFAQVTGAKATHAKHLGNVQIGIDPPAAGALGGPTGGAGVADLGLPLVFPGSACSGSSRRSASPR